MTHPPDTARRDRPPGAVRALMLEGEAEARYVDRLVRVLRAARLNLYYPDGRRLQSHVRCLHPTVHRGLYGGVQMNLDSGLPTYREWTRVQTDVTLAGDQLAHLGPRDVLARKACAGAPIHQKLLAKYDYYHQIARARLTPLGAMDVKLRRVDQAERTAYFHVTLDKLDASGLFVRYAIDLAQTDSAWSRKVVRLDDEDAQHTEAFQSLIYKFTSLGAEFTFAKLSGLAGLRVQRVAKGTVGPIIFAPEQSPAALRPLFDGVEDGFIAMFSLDMVADDIAEDRDNDPLSTRLGARLSPDAAATYRQAREAAGCKVFKDRKFVAPAPLLGPIRRFCAEHGTQNIVYPIR